MVATSRWMGWALGLLSLGAQAGGACDAQLSAAQRARYALALEGCAGAAPAESPAAASPIQTAQQRTPAAESAHLLLFARPGLVATTHEQPAQAPVRVAPPPRPAAKRTSRAEQMAPEIDAVARRHDIDPLLLHAIAYVESRHNPAAVSSAGARGVMQVMPATGARFGATTATALHDTRTNIEVSASYLKTLQQRFGTQLNLVLAAYHAGEGAVERHGRRVPENGQTPGYVRLVLAEYRALTTAARQRSVVSPL